MIMMIIEYKYASFIYDIISISLAESIFEIYMVSKSNNHFLNV